jgi:hypothetical protein
MNDDKTATMRKPLAKANMLGNALITQQQSLELALLTDETVKAYCFGFRLAKQMRDGALSVQDAVTDAKFYMAVLDGSLNLSREQYFFLLRLVYIGAGLKAQADKAEVLFKDQLFGDLPFGRPSGDSLRLV